MERASSLGVRKGAWSKEEDSLLKNCVEQYGEGKWHLVPLRTGLNRCRKSCRLRWLNYLRPNITRGNFSKDEVDLLIRLHKLLGNRWSLIAGRLPGRTANDVKNFWNTRIEKKTTTTTTTKGQPIQKTINKTNILRPRPRTFSSLDSNNDNKLQHVAPSSSIHPSPPSVDTNDECVRWWSSLLDTTTSLDRSEEELPFLDDKLGEDEMGQISPAGLLMEDGDYSVPLRIDELTDDALDDEVWELLGFDDDQIQF